MECARCNFPLHGLPTRYRCPACGLRYDEGCGTYPLPRQWQVLVLTVVLTGVALMQYLSYVNDPDTELASGWRVVFWMAFWTPNVLAGVRTLRGYRRGYRVAVTGDGLLIRLPGQREKLTPWDRIERAEVKDRPEGRPQVALIYHRGDPTPLSLWTEHCLFTKREDVERFVAQVNARAAAADATGEVKE